MTTTPSTQPQRLWRYAAPLFLLLFAWTLFWFRETASAIVIIWWRSETFTHGFLVVPIVLWLVWRKRAALVHLMPKPNAWALIPLALAAFAWLLGDLVAVNALTQLAFVAMLVLLVPVVLGTTVTHKLGFPLAFLFFAVPFGEFAMPQLMQWTADFTVLALRATGVPVYREGLQFVIPSGNWSVVEACSGVRYLIASLTVGTLFAYLNYQSTRRRVLFIIVSLVVPVIANWLRAYLIVMLGHLSGNRLAAGVDHLIYGWVFFGIVIMLMFMIGARWAEPEPDDSNPPADDKLPKAQPSSVHPHERTRLVLFSLTAAVLVAAPQLMRSKLDHDTGATPPQLTAPATLSPGWSAVADSTPIYKPAFDNPSAEVNARYGSASPYVGLYLGYYRHQDYQRKLVSSANVLVKSKDPTWALVASGSQGVTFNSLPISVRKAELRNASLLGQATDERLTVWQIYWVNGTLTASDTTAKAYGALYRLLGRGDDSAVIVLYTPKDRSGEDLTRLHNFVQDNASAIIGLLEKTRSAGQLP